MAGTQPDLQAFLGSFWAWCTGHFWDLPDRGCILAEVGTHPDFQPFHGNFWDSMCRPCPGCVMATVGMEPNFQAILGNFMDTVCKPCPGCGRDASRLSSIFRQFLEHDVHAMFGKRLVRKRDEAMFSSSFRDTGCRPFLGYCKDTS
ncbi:Hypothetical predicted protein [Olea europaea subsp. europaea]|uniref:Uncharacterized protein n=1 Tax=Olea europaea subsp. europaea TaxID=158383 RepID=A0A8S0PNE5_OLEEU|nr:Hypothetical predicted protein [Olea europaea subsp. europaea]